MTDMFQPQFRKDDVPPSRMMNIFRSWQSDSMAARHDDFLGYVQAIAHARFVLRRVMRILDDQAREFGLDPLQHQVLLQVYASPEGISISKIGDRVQVVPAFASRLVSQLTTMGLVVRKPHETDKRVVLAAVTDDGIKKVREIDNTVYRHLRFFQDELPEEARLGALGIFAFYIGLDGDTVLAEHLRSSVGKLTNLPSEGIS